MVACLGDYRALNSATKPDRNSIPHIYDVTAVIQDKSVFTKLDLIRANHQIPVELRYMPKTAITPFRLFEFLRVPFDLRNAALWFQRFINHILHGLHFVCAYMDDVLTASSSKEEHNENVQIVFEHFKKIGVVINSIKCEFGKSEINFLGHYVNSAGISHSPSKVEAIENFPVSDTIVGFNPWLFPPFLECFALFSHTYFCLYSWCQSLIIFFLLRLFCLV